MSKSAHRLRTEGTPLGGPVDSESEQENRLQTRGGVDSLFAGAREQRPLPHPRPHPTPHAAGCVRLTHDEPRQHFEGVLWLYTHDENLSVFL